MRIQLSISLLFMLSGLMGSISAQAIDVEKYFPRYEIVPFSHHDFNQAAVEIPDSIVYKQLIQLQNPSDISDSAEGYSGLAAFDYKGETYAILFRGFRDGSEELYLFHVSDKSGYPALIKIEDRQHTEFCIVDGVIRIFDLKQYADVYKLSERQYRLDPDLTEIKLPEHPTFYEAIETLEEINPLLIEK